MSSTIYMYRQVTRFLSVNECHAFAQHLLAKVMALYKLLS